MKGVELMDYHEPCASRTGDCSKCPVTQDLFAGMLMVTRKGRPPLEVMTVYIGEDKVVNHIEHYGVTKALRKAISIYREAIQKIPDKCKIDNKLTPVFHEVHNAPELYKNVIIRILRDKEPIQTMSKTKKHRDIYRAEEKPRVEEKNDTVKNEDTLYVLQGLTGDDMVMSTMKTLLEYVDMNFEAVNKKIDTMHDLVQDMKKMHEVYSCQMEAILQNGEAAMTAETAKAMCEKLDLASERLLTLYSNCPIIKAPPSMLKEQVKERTNTTVEHSSPDKVVSNAFSMAKKLVEERLQAKAGIK